MFEMKPAWHVLLDYDLKGTEAVFSISSSECHSINIPQRSDIMGSIVNIKCDWSFLIFY
jgi:hypothetical protein